MGCLYSFDVENSDGPLKLSDPAKLPSDELYEITDQIPSDPESNIGDCSDDDIEGTSEYPMMEMEVVQQNEIASIIEICDVSDWESDDEVPLCHLQIPKGRKQAFL
ncbi:hypothetical protein QE152_g1843 [Popillia japonica]|uniref:Uncharacterized protein n=1 Tax=Popillia japonica TaxID=7064 RepID=A0AAW1N7I0_POPJA